MPPPLAGPQAWEDPSLEAHPMPAKAQVLLTQEEPQPAGQAMAGQASDTQAWNSRCPASGFFLASAGSLLLSQVSVA